MTYKTTITVHKPHLSKIFDALGNKKTKFILEAVDAFHRTEKGQELYLYLVSMEKMPERKKREKSRPAREITGTAASQNDGNGEKEMKNPAEKYFTFLD